jgi:hypothetical protein
VPDKMGKFSMPKAVNFNISAKSFRVYEENLFPYPQTSWVLFVSQGVLVDGD